MNRSQAGLLKLLKEIDSLCKDNDITYYTTGGTAIGAVRHAGFIPWDDDIDVYMTLENWEKFHTVMRQNPPANRVLEYWQDNPEYNNLIGRYADRESTQIYQSQLYNDITKGQVIDVFILDPVIDDEEAINMHSRTVMLISDIINEFYIYSKSQDSCEAYSSLYAKARKHGKQAVVSELIPELEKYSEEEASYYILRWGGLPHLFRKEMFARPKYLPFEDMMIPLPTKLAEHLVQLYGLDWLYLPPVQDRFDHGTITDPDRPYREIDSVISSRINKELVTSRLAERKAMTLDNLPEIHHANRIIRGNEGEFVRRRTLWHMNADAIGKDDPVKAGPVLAEYAGMQTNKYFLGNNMPGKYYEKQHPLYVDLGDDYLETVLDLLIRDKKIGKADRLLQARIGQVDRALPDNLANVQQMFRNLKTVQDMIEDERYREAEEIVDTLAAASPNAEVLKYKLYLMQKNGKASSEEFRCIVSGCLSRWPEEVDFCKYLGDIHQMRGETALARQQYSKVLKESSNGILLMELKKNYPQSTETQGNETENDTDPADGKDEAGSAGNAIAKNRYFRLLQELVDLCETHNIAYFVGGGILYYLDNEAAEPPADFSSMDIVMDGRNAAKLLQLLQDLPANRAIESVENNPRLRNLDILYMDTEATGVDLNKLDRRKKLRVSVPIRIARPGRDTAKKSRSLLLEKYWRTHFGYHFNAPQMTEYEMSRFAFAEKVFRNGDKLTRHLFRQNLKQELDGRFQNMYIYDNNTLKTYPIQQWADRKRAALFGLSVYVPADVSSYLNKRFGSREEAIKKSPVITDAQFIDTDFEEIMYQNEPLWEALRLVQKQKLMDRYYMKEYKRDWRLAEKIYREISGQSVTQE